MAKKAKEEPTLSELWRREIAFKCWLKDIPNILDGYAVYVGETFLRVIDNPIIHWKLELNEEDVYYNLPILEGRTTLDCPLTIVTASLDRRTGKFCSSLLSVFLEMYPKNK